jgi:hypothetical protein
MLGNQLRDFAERVCLKYSTAELPREVNARSRRQAKSQSSKVQQKSTQSNASQRKKKAFNLNTYKFHSLGDYVETIRTYGTVDSYSTEIVS